ncbi:MAG: hypothetical protein AAFY72_01250 [Cyanobacteria bacterium J06649_4]
MGSFSGTTSLDLSLLLEEDFKEQFRQIVEHVTEEELQQIRERRDVEIVYDPHSVSRIMYLSEAYGLLEDRETAQRVMESAHASLPSVDVLDNLGQNDNEDFFLTWTLADIARDYALIDDIESATAFSQEALRSVSCPFYPYALCSREKFLPSSSSVATRLGSALRPGRMEEALAAIAAAYGAIGQTEMTVPALSQVVDIAEEASIRALNFSTDNGVFESVAIAYGALDDSAAAKTGLAQLAALNIPGDAYRASVFSAIAKAYRAHNDETAAQAILAEALPQSRSRLSQEVTALIIRKLTSAYAQLSSTPETQLGLAQLLNLANEIDSESMRQRALIDIAIAYQQIGENAATNQIITSISLSDSNLPESNLPDSLSAEIEMIVLLRNNSDRAFSSYIPGAGLSQFENVKLSFDGIFSALAHHSQITNDEVEKFHKKILKNNARKLRTERDQLLALSHIALAAAHRGDTQEAQRLLTELIEQS